MAIVLASLSAFGGRIQRQEVLAMSPDEFAEHVRLQYERMIVNFWPTLAMCFFVTVVFVVVYELLTRWIDSLLSRVFRS